MKILIIWRLLTVGGVNAGWRNRAIFFKEQGIHSEFLYLKDHGGMHIMEDVAPVYLTKDNKKIKKIIQTGHYDAIIVVDTGKAYKWLIEAEYKGPVIVEARTPELIKIMPQLKSFKGIEPLAIITPSEYQKRHVSIITNNIPIHVIYNGVDTNFYHALPNEEISFRNPPPLPHDKKVIGWIGRLDKRKNWQKLIEIASSVKQERSDIEFWVIGGAQSIQREDFTLSWKEQELTDIVKWFPVIPYHEMPHVYAKIRESGGCTIATTRTESFGNTFIEAGICGVPVVAPKMMPVTEIIEDGKTGLLYQQNKIDDAIRKIYEIIDEPTFHKELSKNAIKHVQENFAIEVVAKRYVEVLKGLLSSRSNKSNRGEA